MADEDVEPFQNPKKIAKQLDVISRSGVFAYYTRFTILLIYKIFSNDNIFRIF